MFLSRSCRHLSRVAPNTSTASSKYRLWVEKFAKSNVSEPKSSAGLIVAFALNRKMFNDLTHLEKVQPLTSKQTQLIDELGRKRLKNIPIQYVIEEWDFCGMTLKMKPPVFIPRPETEDLVSFAREEILMCKSKQQNILEVGCGSGAITLALTQSDKLNLQLVNFTAIDKNIDAVNLTQENMELLGVQGSKMKVVHSDILSFASDVLFDGIVTNPPYIPTQEMTELQPEILEYESELALHGGGDGLAVVRSILDAAINLLKPGGWIWMEVDDSHPGKISSIITEPFAFVETRNDFFDKPRFVKIVKK